MVSGRVWPQSVPWRSSAIELILPSDVGDRLLPHCIRQLEESGVCSFSMLLQKNDKRSNLKQHPLIISELLWVRSLGIASPLLRVS